MRLLESAPVSVSNGKRRIVAVLAAGALLACAVALGTMSASVYAEETPGAAQPTAATGAPQDVAKPRDLTCTYYDRAGKPWPGTCAVDSADREKYVCVRNDDPQVRQTQIGCKSKLERQ